MFEKSDSMKSKVTLQGIRNKVNLLEDSIGSNPFILGSRFRLILNPLYFREKNINSFVMTNSLHSSKQCQYSNKD